MSCWQEPFVKLHFPKLFNVRSDPFERADVEATMFHDKWVADSLFLFVPAQVIVKQFMQTMVEFPPRQKAASFTVSDVMEKLEQNSAQMACSAGAGT